MTRKKSYQKGHVVGPIRTRSGCKYILRYRVRMADGKWKQKAETLYGVKGKKEALAVLDQRIRDSSNAAVMETQGLTLTQFVDAYWRPYLNRKRVKPSTRQGYDSMFHLHIAPALGEFRLSDIAPLHIEQLLQNELDGVSPKTQRNIVVLLQSILSLALENDLIEKSPVRGKHKPTVPKRRRPCWTPAQVRAIVEASPPQFRALFVCAALTGARLGELLGLQWKHVDLQSRKLRIEQSLWRDQLVLPKTECSAGALLFDDVLAQTLAKHRRCLNCNKPNDFVFCKSDGSPLNPDVLRKDVLYPLLDRLGIPRERRSSGFHAFRHSASSIVNDRTGNLKLSQMLLRHSNVNTTADIYTHPSDESQRQASRALEQAIFGNCSRNVLNFENKNSKPMVN